MKKLLFTLLFMSAFFSVSALATKVTYQLEDTTVVLNEQGVTIDGNFDSWDFSRGFTVLIGGHKYGVDIVPGSDSQCLALRFTDYTQLIFWAMRDQEVKSVSFCPNRIIMKEKSSFWMYWVVPAGSTEKVDSKDIKDIEKMSQVEFKSILYRLTDDLI